MRYWAMGLLPCRAMLSVLGLGSISDYVVKTSPCNVVVHKMAKA